jgi:hypothetical protein
MARRDRSSHIACGNGPRFTSESGARRTSRRKPRGPSFVLPHVVGGIPVWKTTLWIEDDLFDPAPAKHQVCREGPPGRRPHCGRWLPAGSPLRQISPPWSRQRVCGPRDCSSNVTKSSRFPEQQGCRKNVAEKPLKKWNGRTGAADGDYSFGMARTTLSPRRRDAVAGTC